MYIKRTIQKKIEENLFDHKIIVIYGARQVGKTTLLKKIQEKYQQKESLFLDCDEPDIRSFLSGVSSSELKSKFGTAEIIFIDEAQRVKNIGLSLKLAIDNMPDKQFIVTGSSSFDLANQISEPLTGRKYEFHLHPISLEELSPCFNSFENERLLESRLIYGLYPDVINKSHKAEFVLRNLVKGCLYKDVLEYQTIRHAELLEKLLKALALQIGSEVSYNELASTLKTNKATIERYVRLLEQSFIIFRLTPFSRNLRTELKKLRKIYFYDTGVRNTLINNFNPLDTRTDVGALWENFIISERQKRNNNNGVYCNSYFWRTRQRQEIDYLEEKNDQLSAFEIKYNKAKYKIPKAFSDSYPKATIKIVNKKNYFDFIS